jgi:uncharacterized membrane protein YhiD involved in acid resistance
MTRNERILLNRIRRIAAMLALIILLMSSWIKNLYDDIDWVKSENNTYFYDRINKENQIKFLNQKVDSLKKVNELKVVEKPKLKPKKKVIIKTDSISVLPIDTIKSESINDTIK